MEGSKVRYDEHWYPDGKKNGYCDLCGDPLYASEKRDKRCNVCIKWYGRGKAKKNVEVKDE